ncbi:YqgE/AlgH family protein [Lonepinella koalarum]|uniref:UPF0301 protein EV692_0352 n=1 Tax=Lonepinella koalarum TaxID=53417 RepID=A0A4R1L2Z8_9PAST|nr:YqgE/AlgH family protein [Lonepinella koalarum]MDH2926132.1 hypothetical protein [Lonepinella koalarum]TCK71283.1 putative transcriptional regulator [Lonepinella koalarum]TFJ91002.1 YqgE/AlgH family protein [Lonepinella koalarum]TYG34820.1 YqgE/AlgH family protein [Lonepinella koalarum]
MNLQNHLLIAMPTMDDDYFHRAVIFMCEHNDKGAMGLVLNQPTDLSLTEMVAKLRFMMSDDKVYPQDYVVAGGPVSIERGFILHTPTAQSFLHSYKISDRLQLTTSADVIDTFGTPNAPEKYLVGLGCASWVNGQLEQEIAQNMWLVMPADERIIFDVAYQDRWTESLKLLGIDSHNLSGKAGYC